MFLIPMAGRSRRFFEAGHVVPKYELELWGRPMFDWVLESFRPYFDSDDFRFVLRSDFNTLPFVRDRCRAVGIQKTSFVEIDHDTQGQADTVRIGVAEVDPDEELYIFNADSFHFGFTKPDLPAGVAGFLDVFRDAGSHWSFVDPGEGDRVRATTEKVRVSDLCSDGLYYFRSCGEFLSVLERSAEGVRTSTGEMYVAPMYNTLIADGADVRYRVVDRGDLHICGTPAEYEELRSRPAPSLP